MDFHFAGAAAIGEHHESLVADDLSAFEKRRRRLVVRDVRDPRRHAVGHGQRRCRKDECRNSQQLHTSPPCRRPSLSLERREHRQHPESEDL